MSWKTIDPEKINIKEVVESMVPGSSVDAQSVGIHIMIPRQATESPIDESRVVVTDALLRGAVWAIGLGMLPCMIGVENLHLFPQWTGFLVTGVVLGIVGLVVLGNLSGPFDSNVVETLKEARRVSNKEEMLTYSALAFWAIRDTRPLFARRVNWLVFTAPEGNDLFKFGLRPLRDAMALLEEMQNNLQKDQWFRRHEFDGHIDFVLGKVDMMRNLWARTYKIPEFLIFLFGGASAGILAVTLLVRFLFGAGSG